MKLELLAFLVMFAPCLAMAVEVGDAAPDFSAASTEGKTVKLADYKGKWLVLYFYPKSFTTGCTKEACSLRDGFPKLEGLDAVVLGASFDDLETQKKFREKYNLPYHLLADTKKSVGKAYDAVGFGGLAARRVTYIISPEGKIAHVFSTIDVDKHSAQVADTLEKLKGGAAK